MEAALGRLRQIKAIRRETNTLPGFAGLPPMNHAVIFSHPNPDSFTASVARTYSHAVADLGHDVIVRDLYRMGFNPLLGMSEISRGSYGVPPDVAQERDTLRQVDVFTLVYPLWLYAPPAMLKGYLERVFGFGFAYGPGGASANPMLNGRKLLVFTSSGLSAEWGAKSGNFDALSSLFDHHFAAICGLDLLEHVHFSGISDQRPEEIRAHLAKVEQAVKQNFCAECDGRHKDFSGRVINRPRLQQP
jgi:NAD(P)H dehydrogenase (quinone)